VRGGVHQLLAALSFGDAVSNEALVIQKLLRAQGYASEIFAEQADPRMRHLARPLEDYASVSSPETVCLFHFAIGGAAGPMIARAPDRLVLVYHNITPAPFFLGFNNHLVGLCHNGRRELARYRDRTALALTPSEFNRRELEAMGFARTAVLPIILDLPSYAGPFSPVVESLFRDGKTNVLFVGRVAPNKGLDRLLRAFALFQRGRPRSRLLLVGDDRLVRHYRERLEEMAGDLSARDVVFSGLVDQDELLAYYRSADLFLCLSEHEGFCVPLLEAMLFSVPVLALDRGGVASTLDGAGLLFPDRPPEWIAAAMEEVAAGGAFREAILDSQRSRVAALRGAQPGLLEALAGELPGAR
jgi:glycosyltransferase involved in cell wall biosynthesis